MDAIDPTHSIVSAGVEGITMQIFDVGATGTDKNMEGNMLEYKYCPTEENQRGRTGCYAGLSKGENQTNGGL